MVRAHFLLLSVLPGLLVSCGDSRPVTETEFLKTLVAASRSGKPDAVKALVHPATFQRIDEHNRDFFLEYLSREAERAIPETYRVTTAAIAPDAQLPFEGPFVYPVRPTLSLEIDFEVPPRGSVTMIRSVLVDDDGVWWLVFALPTEATVARMQRSKADVDQIEQIASGLARRIDAPLRGELKALLRDGRKISAIKRYREVSREGLRVAKAVIDVLEAEARSVPSQGDVKE